MQDNTWVAVANSVGRRIIDHIPVPTPAATGASYGNSPRAITNAWNGASVDQRRGEYIMVANGGHADYAGNEAYGINFRQENPAWRRLSDPTPNSFMTGISDEGNGLYADGRPRAMHNTFQCFGDGRVWMPLMNSVTSGGGGSIDKKISWNRDLLGTAATPAPYSTNPWNDYGAVFGGLGLTSMIFGVAVFHRYRHRVYGLGGNGANNTTWWYINTLGPNIGTSSFFQSGQSFGHWGGWAVCAHDLDIIVAGDHLRNAICVLNCATNTWTQITNVSGTGFYSSNSGGVYVAKNRTIGIGHPTALGSSFYRLAIPTTTVNGKIVYNASGQWVWSTISPGGATVTTEAVHTYSRWNIVEDMGDGRSAIVYCGGIDYPTYVYKIPAAGLQ
jgi:hypothetical protein